MMENELICINVGGREFWTYTSTLEKLPGTTLSQIAALRKSHHTYISHKDCYFYDRSPEAFRSILEYYRTDELHVAEYVCGNAMKQELEFWGLSEAEIEPCCWGSYAKYHSHKETLANLESAFGGEEEYNFIEETKTLKNTGTRWQQFKRKAWMALEFPSETNTGKILMGISMSFVIISILETILESHYMFRVVYYDKDRTAKAPNPADYLTSTDTDASNCSNSSQYPHTEPHPVLSTIDDICLAYFLLELIIRLSFCPNLCKFFKSPLNHIDIFCVIPQLISIIIKHTIITHQKEHVVELSSGSGCALLGTDYRQYERAGDFLKAITVLRTVRILRVFKLMKHYAAFKILAYTIKVSAKELLLMVVYLMTGVLIFASIIHYAEKENFDSIPIGFWWALVTMTTVGYGDKHPKELVGYLVGSLCVMSGVLVIAFTVPIVVNNFSLYYTHAKTRIKLPKETVQELRRNKNMRKNLGLSISKMPLVATLSSLCAVNNIACTNEALELNLEERKNQTNGVLCEVVQPGQPSLS
ncbi:potassium voltage-gated channel protein Shaw-like [Watersipora subatra]|uniref:potassium voltage-gated channel protein Shaw-like n=1 Tax=Watersipora subatra TaxID=2589382 RepID=UPI00355B2369